MALIFLYWCYSLSIEYYDSMKEWLSNPYSSILGEVWMPLMVTIQPWVFIAMCWNRQFDFNIVCHPTWKKHPQAGFEPRTPTINPEHTHALDRSTMALLLNIEWCWYLKALTILPIKFVWKKIYVIELGNANLDIFWPPPFPLSHFIT